MTTEKFDIEEGLQDIACRLRLLAKLIDQPNEDNLILGYSEKDGLVCMLRETAEKACDCIVEYGREYHELTRDKTIAA
ncbi:MAG: hypothetical protein C4522_22045 [Desulfobacteraceae bacterium]|nr:MAG: hypothetical protein C4522_22045 [Desulfobacteraceae bacterium]